MCLLTVMYVLSSCPWAVSLSHICWQFFNIVLLLKWTDDLDDIAFVVTDYPGSGSRP